MKHYDYLIVGAGLYGSVAARQLTDASKECLVIDKRDHIGGNVYTENINGINVHKYGAHIFHTNNKIVWDYVNKFATFNRYTNSPIAIYNKNEVYSLPFNMNTFHQIWGVTKPNEAKEIIDQQRKEIKDIPTNLEEQAISLVGKDIYKKLIKEYTEKQWGRDCKDLPSSIIKRLPLRFTYDNNYFNALYQGIPIGGYTKLVEKLLSGIDIILNVDYLKNKDYLDTLADKIIYTGPIDAYFNYEFGKLEYRSLRFENSILNNIDNFQGNAVVNYTSKDPKYTRIIEHKWFEFGKDIDGNNIYSTVITKEYPEEYDHDKNEPYYPINNSKNTSMYNVYKYVADNTPNVIFGGRLAEYKYYDMDQVIQSALDMSEKERLNGN